jgi:KaiC/GvpD/RAD55 family RecA-like ATPase
MNGLAVPAAQVTLMEKGVVQGRYTGLDGVANFRTIPTGNYTLRVGYMFATYESRLNVKGDGVMAVAVPLPHRTVILVGLITAACASIMIIRKRRLRLYPQTFAYFRELTRGGLPEACFTVISGDSGSGKSVLLNSIAGEHLAVGRGVYVTNIEFPDKIRESMVRLGVCGEDEVKSDRLLFIDAYSAIGGESSRAEYYVASHTDLTGLGLNISRCLERVGRGGDVYFDSLNALVTVLRIDYLLNFLQSIAAKVKLNGGKFCVTIGGGVEKADLAKLEEISDCMIETQVQETGRGQRRRLRIKKLRDKPYIDRWTRFRVEQGRGVVFLTPAKPKP